MNVFVHIENAAILPDVKSPAVRKSCGTQHAVARTERFELARSPGRESFGEPRQHNDVRAVEITQTVPAAIGSGQAEVRRDIAWFQFDAITEVAGP